MKRKTRAVRYWLRRESAIEPVHVKTDNRMSKNYLKGKEGDQINAVLCASGYGLRKACLNRTADKFGLQEHVLC